MEEGGGTGAAGDESAKVSTSYLDDDGATRFEVELRPGETTIVSWKKLLKDANRAAKDANMSAKEKCPVPEMPPVTQPAPESRIDPLPEAEAKDAPPASRFSAVIEKIERLYMGKNSSDDEDLNDVPDDDEYDTEDSFIDDAELDEYFQVDNSAIKHDGFFVNRGTLERISEPTTSPEQQQKKRRRKDLAKGPGGSDEGNTTNKHVKVGKKASARSLTLPETNSTNPTLVMALPTINSEDLKVQNQPNSSGTNANKKSANMRSTVNQSPLKVSNGERMVEGKGEKSRPEVFPAKNHGIKLRDGNEFSDTANQMLCKPHYGKSSHSGEDLGQSADQGGKNRSLERSDSIFSEGKSFTQAAKVPHMQRKQGSSVKSKTTMLEKAIRELEKIVAESRPPSIEASDADISQATKRRMPPEIKPKLAKIARLAHSTHGIISKELLKRLMSIVGHLMQLRTLKRNLNAMVMGLSEKEKQKTTARFQQIKKEIDQMVKVRIPLMKSMALEQPGGASDDFQENSAAQKEVLKRKFSMDSALEDKICNLYDLYIEGLEEDSGPQARKLYAELAELWPKGFMDNHGIKRAICRAKDRKKALVHIMKDEQKTKRKKLNPKTEETRQGEINSAAHSQQEKVVTNTSAVSIDKVSGITGADTATKFPTMAVNGPNVDRSKQEKVKGNSNNSNDMKTTEKLAKKKLKRKAESEVGDGHARPVKSLIPDQGEERNKSIKQTTASIQNPLTAGATNSENIG